MKRRDKYVYVFMDPRKPGKYEYGDLCFLYEPFYIGQGRGRRINNHFTYSSLKKTNRKNNKIKSIQKNNLDVIRIKIHNNICENKATQIEIDLINKIGRLDLKSGPLCNHTKGGDGIIGYIFTKEDRNKMSLAQINSPNNSSGKTLEEFLGVKKAQQVKEKLRLSKLGSKNPSYGKPSHNSGLTNKERYGVVRAKEIKNTLSNTHKGKNFSEETKLKMSKVRKGKKRNDTSNFHGQPKIWKFTKPNGEKEIIKGKFKQFCLENNLPFHTFTRIVNNGRENKFWRGWTVEKIF